MTESANTTPQSTPEERDDFEHSLRALETLVEQLEGGQLPLTESLKHFEEGVKLARHCHTLLDTAQLTLTQLTDVNDPDSEHPLEGVLNSNGSNETSD
jgi:exodeoxyribonuclease VII small subunit